MCGIFGFAASKPVKHMTQALIQLAIYNENRGTSAWGVYDGTDIIKDVGPIGRNLYKIPFKDEGVLIGHTRAATVGDNKKPNAHPFGFKTKEGKPVVGVHNGSIYNWKDMNDKYKRKLEVDSMQIFQHIADGLPLGELQGYGAIVCMKGTKLFFSRFNGGQLSIAQLKKNRGIVWSSDEAALKKALEGAGMDFFLYGVTEGDIFYYDDDRLYAADETFGITGQKQTRTNYSTNNYQDSLIDEDYITRVHGCGTSQKKTTKEEASKRIIRFCVVKPNFAALTPEEQALETIKKHIEKDETVSTVSSFANKCDSCKCFTTRRVPSSNTYQGWNISKCLSCIATEIRTGKYSPQSLKEQMEPDPTTKTITYRIKAQVVPEVIEA